MNKKLVLIITLLCTTTVSVHTMEQFKNRLFSSHTAHSAEVCELLHVDVGHQVDYQYDTSSNTEVSNQPTITNSLSKYMFNMYRVMNVIALVAGIVAVATSCEQYEQNVSCKASIVTAAVPFTTMFFDIISILNS